MKRAAASTCASGGAALRWAACAAWALLAGCAAVAPATDPVAAPSPATAPARPPPAQPGPGADYRCEGDVRISVLFAGDTARVAGLPQGNEVLLRDAGGLTADQSVWSNPRLRAEFGLGEHARRAVLHPLDHPGGELHCTREG